MIKLPLVGPAYKMQSQSISCQNCINWYPQTIEYPNGSRVAALMPTPGLKKIFIGEVAATRCLYVLSNGALLAVIGKKLYHSKANKFELTEIGLISALGTVRIADNGQVALIVNGTYTYAFDLKTLALTRLSGSTIPRSTHVLFLDGRFVVNKANTGQFYWSDLYSTKVNALSYATAESTPDNITAIVTFNRELWLFGSQSVERYYGTGSSNSPFSRLSGGAMAFGCLAPDSIVSLSTGVIWLGVSEFGGSQIVMSAGGIPERISTHALEEEISSFSKTSDALAYAYQIEGHVFYVISFPSANVTYCFDVSTGLWHQRSFANAQGLHERHRSQHHAYFNNTHIVGDYRNGKLYQLDNNTFTDDGELILRERTAQAVITDKKLTRFNKLEIVCETGFYGEVKKEDPQPPIISCVGASNSIDIHDCILINQIDAIYPDKEQWVVNGINYENMPDFLSTEQIDPPITPPPVGYEWSTSLRMKNNLDSNVRMERIFTPSNQNIIKSEYIGNTTVDESVLGRQAFCLAGAEPVYPPYAVVKTSALWGSSFPAKITVNGIEHTGDLFGDLADILAHQYNIYTGFERIYSDFEGDPDLVRVVFAGDVFAENTIISVEFLSVVSIDFDDSFSYPENDTLKINGRLASFKIGKLVCIAKVAQYGNINNSNYLLVYGQPFDFRVGDKINTNVLTERVAGEGIEDPTDNCATAASPEFCVQSNLLSNLIEQWNPELSTINVKGDWVNHSQVIMPLNTSDPFATAKFVVQPSEKISINDMYFLGFTIPKCDDLPT